MMTYLWTRAYRGRKWHIAKEDHWSLPDIRMLCGSESFNHPSEWEPLVFGNQDPPRRACMKCVDKVIREEQ